MYPLSKAWDWKLSADRVWLTPSEESYYLAARWKDRGFTEFLDFGCGLGRHSILFARQGFRVSAFDLSPDAVSHTNQWAERENLQISVQQSDMHGVPYADQAFDCLLGMHVIQHTDTGGINIILREIHRILKPGAEFFITLLSKESWRTGVFSSKIDENTLLKAEDGPEKNVPHFFADMEDILKLTDGAGLRPIRIRHGVDCYPVEAMQPNWHYFILGSRD